MIYNKLSGFSDEISSEISVQFEVLNKLGISFFEPRGIDGKNISELNESEVLILKDKMEKPIFRKVRNIGNYQMVLEVGVEPTRESLPTGF